MATYYATLRIWSTLSLDPIWLRSLSLFMALAGLASTVHLARRWLSDGWATWTGVFVALSFLWADQAAEARSYALTMFLVVISWLVLDRLIARGSDALGRRGSWACAYIALWLLLPPTHGLTGLVLA